MTRFAPVFFLTVLLAWAPAALAAGVNIGAVSQVPSVSGVAGRVAAPGINSSLGSTNGAFGGGVASGGGMTVSNSDGVSVQTNIDASHNVQAGSTLNVNETINGVQVGYGMGGNFLAGADAQAQDIWAQKQALYQQIENQAAFAVQVWQAQGN